MDTDGDKVGDNADTDDDDDGLPDLWELTYGLNPRDAADAAADPDGDGVSNYDEFLGHSDPQNPNSVPTRFVERELPEDFNLLYTLLLIAGIAALVPVLVIALLGVKLWRKLQRKKVEKAKLALRQRREERQQR
jgi:hypothetical protein